MLEARITVEAPELAQALNNLALAIRDARPAAPAQQAPTIPNNVVPMAQPQTQQPIQAAPQQQTAPTAAVPLAQPPQYTVDQIMAAGAQLMDAGKVNELIDLLHSFGVQAVMDLKPDQLGAFATALREMGAKI